MNSTPPPSRSRLESLTSFARVLGYQRFPLGMVVALFVILQVPQIREFLLIYRWPSWPALWEAVFVVASALAAWYAGRMTYRVDPDSQPNSEGRTELVRHPNLRRRMPRFYAFAVPLAPALACWQLRVFDKAILYAAIGLVLLALVRYRRPMMRRLNVAPNMRNDAADDAVVSRWVDLGKAERRSIVCAAVAAVALWLLSGFQPNWAAAWFGTTGVLFLSGGVVALLGTVLVQLAARAQVPLTLALFGWVLLVAFIPFGKLHRIDSAQPTIATAQERLAAPMPDPFLIDAGHSRQPVLVAAEGGGIRAAYWTALTLHTLDELTQGEFRRHVRLASGVSGGSLGLATYALTPRAAEQQGECTAEPLPAGSAHMTAMNLAHCFLAEDYLGPVALRMLWWDTQRLLFPVPLWTDRGEALEDGWARQWRRLTGRDDFDGALSSLDTSTTTWVFNATHVQSGRRVIQSAPWIPNLDLLAPAALDGRAVVGTEIALKQAVHNSARFTYVSPAGAIERSGSVLQLVDGGYYENSGLTLIDDWLLYEPRDAQSNLKSMAESDPFVVDVASQEVLAPPLLKGLSPRADSADPIVMLLSNDPSVAPQPTHCEAGPPVVRESFKHELIAPVSSLLQTRSARGAYARQQARALVGEEDFFHFAVHRGVENVAVPLGWALSEASIDEMQRQLWCEPKPGQCEYSNAARLEKLAERFGTSVESARARLAALCEAAKLD